MENLTDATYAAHSSEMVTGLFPDKESAEQAYQAISERGYDENELNLMMSDATCQRYFADELAFGSQTQVTEANAALGGTVGAIAGAITAPNGSLLIPGLGLVVAGPLAVCMTGVDVGGITGGLAGALVGWGIPEEHAKEYESGIKHGDILMAVKPHNEQDALYLEQNWKQHHGQSVYH